MSRVHLHVERRGIAAAAFGLIIIVIVVGSPGPAVSSPPDARPRDPTIARADVVSADGPATVASVGLTHDGSLLVAYNTRGDVLPGARVGFTRSSDGGLTWQPSTFSIADGRPEAGVNITATSLWRVPSRPGAPTRIVMFPLIATWPVPVDEQAFAGRRLSAWTWVSDDDGRTFRRHRRWSGPSTGAGFFQGNVVDPGDGTLLVPWGRWGRRPAHGFKRSRDGGLSWSRFEVTWQDPPPGEQEPLAFNETAVAACPGGAVVAVARVDTRRDKRFWMIRSADQGRTFSSPRQLDVAGGSPALHCQPDGQLWLAYRDAGLGPGVGLSVSDDGGDSWRFLFHLKEPTGEHERLYGHVRYTDEDRAAAWRPQEGVAGYPFFQALSPDEVYVVFHVRDQALLPRRLLIGDDPYYIAGNLLVVPRSPPTAVTGDAAEAADAGTADAGTAGTADAGTADAGVETLSGTRRSTM